MESKGQIVSVLGSNDLFEYCEEYGIKMSKDIAKVVHDYTMRSNISGRRKPWLKLIGSSNREKGDHSKNQIGEGGPCPIPSNDSLNLLDKLLVYNHEKRLTAREAMMHPFFDEVRDLVEMEVKQRWNAEQRIRQKLDHRYTK
jgi:casein kinase II subunit alpha